jgi:hypothetical protein
MKNSDFLDEITDRTFEEDDDDDNISISVEKINQSE